MNTDTRLVCLLYEDTQNILCFSRLRKNFPTAIITKLYTPFQKKPDQIIIGKMHQGSSDKLPMIPIMRYKSGYRTGMGQVTPA
jgi:hypothetical protein